MRAYNRYNKLFRNIKNLSNLTRLKELFMMKLQNPLLQFVAYPWFFNPFSFELNQISHLLKRKDPEISLRALP